MSLESDRALLDAFRRGERAALARVYRLYAEQVARALRAGVLVVVEGRATRMRGALPESELEALVQETFLRAFGEGARLRYDGVRPYGAYLCAIARNLLVDRARAAGRELCVDNLEESLAGEQVDPAEQVAAREIATIVAGVRDALPARERAVFGARYEQGMALRESAAALGMSLITVRRVDAGLRARLLEALRAGGYLSDVQIGIPRTERDRSKG